MNMILNKLSEIMGRKRIKMSDLARMTGLAKSTIFDFYHDKSRVLKLDTLSKVCWALECKVEDILEYIPDEEV